MSRLGALWSRILNAWSSMFHHVFNPRSSHQAASDLDVLRSVNMLIGEYGEGAGAEALHLSMHFAARQDT